MRTFSNPFLKWFCALLCLGLAFAHSAAAQVVTNPEDTDPGYAARKMQAVHLLPAATGSPRALAARITKRGGAAARPVCFEAVDTSATGSAILLPRNDDGSFGPVSLGFNFSLFGTIYNQVYINTNGNITFDAAYGEYNASGFPINVPMIAPFWADVDTRSLSSGRIAYQLYPDRLVVTWNRVAYFTANGAGPILGKNTFQLTIKANTAPTFTGNDVLFAYDDMQWTTGNASGGSGGFGGTAATVGANKGNNVDFIQTGRFNQNSAQAPNSPNVGDPGGVNYLDNQCLGYQVRGGGNVPPAVAGFPAGNTLTVTQGQTATASFQFSGPETNQTVNVTSNLGGLCNTTATVVGNNTANPTVNLSVTGAACNLGSHTITFTALDNGTPLPAQATFTLTVVVVPPATPAPTLTLVNPTSGPVGTSVTLTGTNLTGATAVSFNGTAATTFALVNSTTITATVPAGATTGNVTVTTPGGTGGGVAFAVTAAPTSVVSITRLGASPTNASTVSYRVTFAAAVTGLTASNFALVPTGSVAGASITSVTGSGTTYTVAVSTGTGSGTLGLNLTNATGLSPGLSNTLPFVGEVYTIDKTAPTVTITSPTVANGGTTTTSPITLVVTFSEAVTGYDISDATSGISNAAITTFTANSATTYTLLVTPSSVGTVSLAVAANAAQDAAGNGNVGAALYSFSYNMASQVPTITTLSPATGPVGTSVMITGTNLTGATAVRFNGTPASSFVVNSATSITAIVAAGTTTGLVTVTTPGGTATSTMPFVVRVAPITVPDSYTTPQNVTLTGNVLTNDIGTNPIALLIIRPTHGTLALNPDGTFTYQPAAGYVGPDSFIYYACDPNLPLLCGNPVTVSIMVIRVAPITVPDTYTTPQGVLLTGNVLTNDIGTNPQAILIIRPTHGTLLLNPNGTFTYQPAAGYVGPDSFIYYACNMGAPLVCGDPATVSITVTPATNSRSAATAAKSAATAKPGTDAASELALTGNPNPFAEQLRLSFALPTAQAYTLALYDAQGRLVQQLASGQTEAGQIQELAVSTQSYATGLYLVRLTTATGSQLLKLLKQ